MTTVYKIEVDEKVWEFLKENAEPFEDTPNSVLHRLLFGSKRASMRHDLETRKKDYRPKFPPGMPKALSQTLEMVYEVRKHSLSRSEATRLIAHREGVAPQTIIDKYCRQLGKKAYEIDKMLNEYGLSEFRSTLGKKFPRYRKFVDEFLSNLET